MKHSSKLALSVALTFLVAGGIAVAAPRDSHGGGGAPAPRGEPHAGPTGYKRVTEPPGWNARPTTVSRPTYNHNFQAARSYKIGPYHAPAGWVARQWTYGQILPRAYWTANYFLSDYWLFGLEVPPAGYEWVRDGNDAILVSTATGEILQVEYGVFA
jgi:Ni/Co efflux regulator RcnB